MVRRIIELLLTIVVGVIIIACTDIKETDEIPAGISLNVESLSFDESTSSQTVKVKSGSKWSISEKPEWVTVKAIERGYASMYEWPVSLSVSSNDGYNRDGTIIFQTGSKTVTLPVSQNGKRGVYVEAQSVSLSMSKMTMSQGETSRLSFTTSPTNASILNVTWSSSNTSVATVSSGGVVTALAEGTATITVTINDGARSSMCSVTVKPVNVSSVTLDKESIELSIGTHVMLTATVLPANATDKSVTWSSDNTSVATVSSSGDVKAISSGLATITVTTNDSAKISRCSVRVTPDVDLGLSVKWASFNVGATTPEEYGDYFAWGETEPYYASQNPLTWKDGKSAGYEWSSYKWCRGSDNTLTRYNNSSSYGNVDGMKEFKDYGYEDDAARANWGGKWRTPTIEEWNELRNSCTWTWTSQKGVNGVLVRGKNGNSIFLPAAGSWSGVNLSHAGYVGDYWSSSCNLYGTLGSPPAYEVYFDSNAGRWNLGVYAFERSRICGMPIRPVLDR